MFISEKGSNRYLYLSGHTPFEVEITPSRGETETHIYFRNTTEFNESESRQRFGCYKTEAGAKEAFQRFINAFSDHEETFEFDNETEG